MLDNKSGRTLQGADADLVSQITGNLLDLRHALEKLDQAFASEMDESKILDAIREAVQICQKTFPAQLQILKQHISVRAGLEELNENRVRNAMGGPARRDAYFHRLFARGLEQQIGDSSAMILACMNWDEFRLAAIQEGWFVSNGTAVATLYLHMAKLLEDVPEETIHSFEQMAHKNGPPVPDLFFIRSEKLYETACALDPHAASFSTWLERAEKSPV